jgi:formate dehydrogenase subunit gamma
MTSTAGWKDTANMTTPQPEARRVRRFSRTQRLVHRTTGWLMLLCVASAACLYVPPLAQLVGRRHLMVIVHEWSGILLPAPFLLALTSTAFRTDLRKLNRFAPYDREWLRTIRHSAPSNALRPAGKFNAGQKIYAGLIAGTVPVMLLTGLLMWFTGLRPLVSRTSAIFVHDWLALAVGAVLIGHIAMAWSDPHARRGMRTGYVGRSWARQEHPLWVPQKREEEKLP